MIKKSIRFFRRKINIVDNVFFILAFVRKNRYIPNFKFPKTYNEKINYRKSNSSNKLFSICSDKIKVKDWVSDLGYNELLIETYFTGKNIEYKKVKSLLLQYGDILVKANHNSGPVCLLTTDASDEDIAKVCDEINSQLLVDYGKIKREPWYSDIEPAVLVEKRIKPVLGDRDLNDYKFHAFKQKDGTFKILLHIDFERSANHNRSFFDENLNWLPFSVEYPCLVTEIDKPKNFEKMLEIVKDLAQPFSYVRVDLYNVDGVIYFGELTFAHGSGAEKFTSEEYDLWLGSLWECNPSS